MTSSDLDQSADEAVQARLTQLETQQSYMTRALVAAVEGRWTGPDSVEAWVYALNPTLQGELHPDPPYVPRAQ